MCIAMSRSKSLSTRGNAKYSLVVVRTQSCTRFHVLSFAFFFSLSLGEREREREREKRIIACERVYVCAASNATHRPPQGGLDLQLDQMHSKRRS